MKVLRFKNMICSWYPNFKHINTDNFNVNFKNVYKARESIELRKWYFYHYPNASTVTVRNATCTDSIR